MINLENTVSRDGKHKKKAIRKLVSGKKNREQGERDLAAYKHSGRN